MRDYLKFNGTFCVLTYLFNKNKPSVRKEGLFLLKSIDVINVFINLKSFS